MTNFFDMLRKGKTPAQENLLDQAVAQQGTEDSTNVQTVTDAVDFQAEIDALDAENQASQAGDATDSPNMDMASSQEPAADTGSADTTGLDDGLNAGEANAGDTSSNEPSVPSDTDTPSSPDETSDAMDNPQSPEGSEDPTGSQDGEPAPEQPAEQVDQDPEASEEVPSTDTEPEVDAETPPEEGAVVDADAPAPVEPPVNPDQPEQTPDNQDDGQEQGQAESDPIDEQAQEDEFKELNEAAERLSQTLAKAVELYAGLEREHQVGSISQARESMAAAELGMLGSPLRISVESSESGSTLSAQNLKNGAKRVMAFIAEMLARFGKWFESFRKWIREAYRSYLDHQSLTKNDSLGALPALGRKMDELYKQLNPTVLSAKREVLGGMTFTVRGFGPDTYDIKSFTTKLDETLQVCQALAEQKTCSRFAQYGEKILDVIQEAVKAGKSYDELVNDIYRIDTYTVEEDFSSVSGAASKYIQPIKGNGLVFADLPGKTTIGVTYRKGNNRNIGDIIALMKSVELVYSQGMQAGEYKLADSEQMGDLQNALEAHNGRLETIGNAIGKDVSSIITMGAKTEALYATLKTTFAVSPIYTPQEVKMILDLVNSFSQEACARLSMGQIRVFKYAQFCLETAVLLCTDIFKSYHEANYNEA